MNKTGKKEQGITLVALIITIIIMLIILGISARAFIGRNGIIQRTQQTSIEMEKASVKEEIELARSAIEMEALKQNKTLTKQDLANELESNLLGSSVEAIDNIIEGEYKDYVFEIDDNNQIIMKEQKMEGEKPSGKAEILDEQENCVTIQVIGNIDEGKIESIEAINGAVAKEDASNTNYSQMFTVDTNGTFYFKIKADNGRSQRVSVRPEKGK